MFKRIATATGSVLLLISLFTLPIAAGTSANVGGSFTVAGAPAVTVTAPSEMSPLTEQTVTVNVDMGSGIQLSSLTNVMLKLWYDADGGSVDVTDFNAASASTQTCAVITWNASDFALTPSSSTTWGLGTCISPTLSAQSGDFVFKFTPGKVATEADGSPEVWQSAATATATDLDTGFGYDSTPSTMDLYQQLSISGENPTLSWGTVTKGMAFGNGSASMTALGQTITIISNANYDLKGQSSQTWTSNGDSAYLDPAGGTESPQEFALRVDNDATIADALLLNYSAANAIKSGTITGENGNTYDSINVWLQLSGTFEANTYNGTVTFSVSNHNPV